ncbi:MAG: transglutaminase domain-containing protein, partial [bacterium]|nr:transglutaminase domain-containing protein [bacterium]
ADDGTGALFTPTGMVLVRASADELHRDPEGTLSLPFLSSARIYGVLHVRGTTLEESDRTMREACLEVPEETDPRLRELAAKLAEGTSSPEELVQRTVEHVGSTCRYSLDVGKFESDQPVAEFLFEKKRGYCQYFASAAALLLRLQGVPTRYIGGFNVTGSNRRGGHYVIRESDAHAWIEVYIPGKGWVEADPTPSAEYEALHADLQGGWLNDVVEWAKAGVAEWMVRIRQGDWRSMLHILGRKLRYLVE